MSDSRPEQRNKRAVFRPPLLRQNAGVSNKETAVSNVLQFPERYKSDVVPHLVGNAAPAPCVLGVSVFW